VSPYLPDMAPDRVGEVLAGTPCSYILVIKGVAHANNLRADIPRVVIHALGLEIAE